MTSGGLTGYVELARGNPALAAAELRGALSAVGGREVLGEGAAPDRSFLRAVHLPARSALEELAGRLALARRVLLPAAGPGPGQLDSFLRSVAASGRSLALRPLGRPRSPVASPEVLELGRRFRAAGGRVDLDRPDVRCFVWTSAPGAWELLEEVAAVDRDALARRRMPALPFQRPVSLPPSLGRAAANLAAIRPGDRVIDPFVGTGALLLEAALLGARVSGVDRDPAMIRGALRNLSAFGVSPERVVVDDAAAAFDPPGGGRWDVLLTDPPYGRASGSGGEPPGELLRRALPAWADRLGPEGRIVLVVPGGPDPFGPEWRACERVPDRVHRSLTREFRLYRRAGAEALTSRTTL